ncbi:hypothetical protein HMPREF1431_00052 [Helicobacter pylori GAMchJs106B]|nr:hypothetical protein HMPREF1431_00052 [Helicobacter pylori GAMchJs106B]
MNHSTKIEPIFIRPCLKKRNYIEPRIKNIEEFREKERRS